MATRKSFLAPAYSPTPQSAATQAQIAELVRQHVAEVVAGMSAAGLVQTEDTGQLDPTFVPSNNISTSSGTNYTHGYLMFRFNDALQATAPVFVKIIFITYNTSPSASTSIAYNVVVGTATNGVGGLLTNYTAGLPIGVPASSIQSYYDSNIRPYYWSGDGSYLCMAPAVSDLAASNRVGGRGYLTIERTRDLVSGLYDADGILITYGMPANAVNLERARPVPGKTPPSGGNGRVIVNPFISSNSDGANLYLSPALGDLVGPKAQPLCELGMYSADMNMLSEFDVEIDGTSHHYVYLGAMTNGSSIASGVTGTLAMRYE